MPKLIRTLWTAAVVIALAWPLLFWGKAALPKGSRDIDRPLFHYNLLERHDVLW